MKKSFFRVLILMFTFGCFGLINAFGFTVEIDIKPGSDVNPVNPRSNGIITVAILTDDGFDATTVDPATVKFGPDEASIAHKTGRIKDVDEDGDMDMVLHFRTRETGIEFGDTEACIVGQTIDGLYIQGCDSIGVLNNPGNGPKGSKEPKGPKGPKSWQDLEDDNDDDEDDDSGNPGNSKKPKKPKKAPGVRTSIPIRWGKIKASR